MPQDTTYNKEQLPDSMFVRDSVSHGTEMAPIGVYRDEKTNQANPALWITVLLVAIVIIPTIWRYLRSRYRTKKVQQIYDDKQILYDNILQQFMPYYRKLSTEYKERFLKRTLTFMESKEFEFIDIQEEENMPLLISAASVQLTFGLNQYLMDYFTRIYVMKQAYRYGLYNVPFEGHVNNDGIYLSWDNFLKEFTNYQDGDNVGLHEMAHALSYVNFTADDGSDEAFKERFVEFSETGRPLFAKVQSGEITFLGSYAATNYEEFWAVCVENFFERPESFRIQIPELYTAMSRLLNQDLLSPSLFPEPVENTY